MIHHASLEPYIGWAAGRLVFEDTPLRDVMPELARWYGLPEANMVDVFPKIANFTNTNLGFMIP